jgi:hypothetical protein
MVVRLIIDDGRIHVTSDTVDRCSIEGGNRTAKAAAGLRPSLGSRGAICVRFTPEEMVTRMLKEINAKGVLTPDDCRHLWTTGAAGDDM